MLTKLAVFRQFRMHGLNRKARREVKARWRKQEQRALASPSAIFRFLDEFHNEEEEEQRREGKAFIPEPNKALQGLQNVVDDIVAFMQRHQTETTATLDMDATLDGTHKRKALFCYKGFKRGSCRRTNDSRVIPTRAFCAPVVQEHPNPKH